MPFRTFPTERRYATNIKMDQPKVSSFGIIIVGAEVIKLKPNDHDVRLFRPENANAREFPDLGLVQRVVYVAVYAGPLTRVPSPEPPPVWGCVS